MFFRIQVSPGPRFSGSSVFRGWVQALEVAHQNTIYFLRYVHMSYAKSLFTNIQKQQNMLKISLLFKKFINFTGKQLENS